jgi:alkaline phosphatase D
MRLCHVATLVAAAVLLAIGVGPASGAEPLVTVGDATATTAQLWLSAPGVRHVGLTLEPKAPAGGSPAVLVPGEDGRATATLRGLSPATRYRYWLRINGAPLHGEFVTAPPPDEPAPVTLAWSGDLGSRRHCRRSEGWVAPGAIAERRPDLFLFVGDTIYADHHCRSGAVPGADFVASTLEEFRAKHRYNREDPAIQRLFRTTSVSAIWDDHEVRSNFAGPVEPLMPVALQAFLEYWPIAPAPEDPTRLYRRLRWGSLLDVFILDTRRYRSRNCARDGPDKTMLGASQRRWLVDEVARSPATWKVIVSSVPLSIPKGWPFGDSWARRSVLGYVTGFATERDRILRELHARGVDRLVVLAADVHFAAFMTHRPLAGLEVHELLAGPLAAGTRKPAEPGGALNTQLHFAYGGTPTFGELRVDMGGLTARLLDAQGRLLTEQRWDSGRN